MTELVGYLVLFLAVGFGFIFVHLLAGKLIRPAKPDPEKLTIYECGEPTIGSAWVQFDLRFYVVALLFVIFDVEVAFFFPWAVVFGKATTVAAAPLANPDPKPPPDSPQLRQAKVELLQQVDPNRPMPEPRDLQVLSVRLQNHLARRNKNSEAVEVAAIGQKVVGGRYQGSPEQMQRDWARIQELAGLALNDPGVSPEEKDTAGRLAALAFWDILVFFGVLLVGFAYLWKRGDLDWVRSLAAERAGRTPEATPAEPAELVAAGRW